MPNVKPVLAVILLLVWYFVFDPQFSDPGAHWILFFALSASFVWVYTLGWWKRIKPFKCLKCMCGWTTLLICIVVGHDNQLFMVLAGVFAGALFDAVKSRWL